MNSEIAAPTLLKRLDIESQIAKNQNRLDHIEKNKNETVGKINDFVGYLYGMMLQQMRKSIPENELFNGGRAEKIFNQQLDSHFGNLLAKNSPPIVNANNQIVEKYNPLTRSLAKSVLKSFDRQKEWIEGKLEELNNQLAHLEKTGQFKAADSTAQPPVIQKDLDSILSKTREQIESIQVENAGRLPISLGVKESYLTKLK